MPAEAAPDADHMHAALPRRPLLAAALSLLALPGVARVARGAEPGCAAFLVRRADRDVPSSILIPGVHWPVAGIPVPHPNAFAGRGRLLLEYFEDGTEIAPLLTAAEPPDYAAHVGAAGLAILAAVMRCVGHAGPPDALRPFVHVLGMLPAARRLAERGRCPDLPGASALAKDAARIGGDPWLVAIAEARRLPVGGVESHAEALRALARIPDAVMLRVLRRVLGDAGGQVGEEALVKLLVEAVTSGDFDRVREVCLDAFAGEASDRDVLARHMLDERNALMAERLAPVLAAESVVVALGAAHAGGPEGVMALLRRAGLRVEPVRVDAYTPQPR